MPAGEGGFPTGMRAATPGGSAVADPEPLVLPAVSPGAADAARPPGAADAAGPPEEAAANVTYLRQMLAQRGDWPKKGGRQFVPSPDAGT